MTTQDTAYKSDPHLSSDHPRNLIRTPTDHRLAPRRSSLRRQLSQFAPSFPGYPLSPSSIPEHTSSLAHSRLSSGTTSWHNSHSRCPPKRVSHASTLKTLCVRSSLRESSTANERHNSAHQQSKLIRSAVTYSPLGPFFSIGLRITPSPSIHLLAK